MLDLRTIVRLAAMTALAATLLGMAPWRRVTGDAATVTAEATEPAERVYAQGAQAGGSGAQAPAAAAPDEAAKNAGAADPPAAGGDTAEDAGDTEPRSDAPTPEPAERAADLLAQYIRIDTVNPPGNEIAGAKFLAALLEAEGIPFEIFESEPGRGNLYARLKGTGEKRAVVLLSHLDVVAAEASEWDHPPFDGVITEDGYVYGRGALDAKGISITQLLATVALAREGKPLARDIILLATAGEETGGSVGAKWFLENHFNRIKDAEFVLNEGGFIRRNPGTPLIFNLTAAEKGPCWFDVVAEGEPGHGSRPAAQTAVTRLVDALAKLHAWEQPLEVGPVVAGYFAAYAAVDSEHARQFRQLNGSLEDEEFRKWFLSDPATAALVRNTVAATVLEASFKTNVIPARATAKVDARLLPGKQCGEFLSEVRRRVGGEGIVVQPGAIAFESSQSPLDNELTAAVERLAAADSEAAVVLPGLLTGFTDSHYFRARGIAAYGFTPIVVTPEERRTLHGPNERVSVESLENAVRRMTRLLRDLAS